MMFGLVSFSCMILWVTPWQMVEKSAETSFIFNFPELINYAEKHAEVQIQQAIWQNAKAKADEVYMLQIPKIEITTLAGPSPYIQCHPSVESCISTYPTQMRIGFGGVFWRINSQLEMPLFTFGKISAGRQAASQNAQMEQAKINQLKQQAAFDAAKVYFAVKLGRSLLKMLEEGQGYIERHVKQMQKLREDDSSEISEMDYRRLMVLQQEVEARLSEAYRVSAEALAGIHYMTAMEHSDVDAEILKPLYFQLPEDRQEARYLSEQRSERKQALAAKQAAKAMLDLQYAGFYPDFVLVGSFNFGHSTSVDHPHNAFLNDPFNVISGGLGVVLRWAPELGIRFAKINQAKADFLKAEAFVRKAQTGTAAEAEQAWAQAQDALYRRQVARQGIKHARSWLVSLLQGESAGLVESRDLGDALLQSFMMQARHLQALYDWNIAVMAYLKAIGKRPFLEIFEAE